MKKSKITFPIDLVCLWVDGADPKWRAKRNQYMNTGGEESAQGVIEARWVENDELRYSLRSVEKYAPWINRIFIITDNQCPSWLDTENPKVQIVDHSEILPADALPTFNSVAIESCICNIPNLNEHFILGNDDTLFCAPVTPETFFTTDGRAIIRLNKQRFNRRKALRRGNYNQMVRKMQDLITQTTGAKIYHAPHHNFDSYLKSVFEECRKQDLKAWMATAHHRFRHDEDMLRCFVGYYMLATGKGVMRKVGRYNRINGIMAHIDSFLHSRFGSDSRCIPLTNPDFDAVLHKYNPLMICMNDGEGSSDNDRKRMVEFLENLFPDKSSFEK